METVIFSKLNEKIIIDIKLPFFGALRIDLFEVGDKCVDNNHQHDFIGCEDVYQQGKIWEIEQSNYNIRHRNGFKRKIF